MATTTPDELKAEIAIETAALLVGDTVSDQEQLTEWPKLVGSLYKAFSDPAAGGWQDQFPALKDDTFRTRMATKVARILVVNQVESQLELNELGKVAGSVGKALNSPEWQAALPALKGAAPSTGPVAPPAAPNP